MMRRTRGRHVGPLRAGSPISRVVAHAGTRGLLHRKQRCIVSDLANLRSIPKEINARRALWNRNATLFHGLFVTLTVLGTVAGLAVSAFADVVSVMAIRGLGFLAASCSAVVAATSLGRMGDRYREAWRILDLACMKYQADSTRQIGTLLSAIRTGEACIGYLGRSEATTESKGEGDAE